MDAVLDRVCWESSHLSCFISTVLAHFLVCVRGILAVRGTSTGTDGQTHAEMYVCVCARGIIVITLVAASKHHVEHGTKY